MPFCPLASVLYLTPYVVLSVGVRGPRLDFSPTSLYALPLTTISFAIFPHHRKVVKSSQVFLAFHTYSPIVRIFFSQWLGVASWRCGEIAQYLSRLGSSAVRYFLSQSRPRCDISFGTFSVVGRLWVIGGVRSGNLFVQMSPCICWFKFENSGGKNEIMLCEDIKLVSIDLDGHNRQEESKRKYMGGGKGEALMHLLIA